MTHTGEFGTFFLPGPTEVRAEVLEAMLLPMLPHRGARYEALHARIVTGLQQVFRTKRPVYLMSCSATGAMEMAIRGAPEGPILSLVNGAFSERFARIAQSCDRSTRVLSVPLGDTPHLEQVEEALVEGGAGGAAFAAVTVVHSETSTGALSDIHAITELAHRHGAMCLVDSVTGIAGTRVETDAWGLDFVLTGSQKALALPPGLAFAVASEAYVLQASNAPSRGRYLDVVEYEEFARRSQTPNTPALSLLYAAECQLEQIRFEGIEARWIRHAEMLARTEAWVESLRDAGLAIGYLCRPGERSPTVSTITLPEAMKATAVVARVAELGFVIGTGYGALKERTIRIGHMGDHTVDTLEPCLGAVEQALRAG
jgi:aspartate aminotransferase-like enzyme